MDRIRLYRVGPTPAEAKKLFDRDTSDTSPSWIRDAAQKSGLIEASGRWFTSSRDEAKWYEREHPAYRLRSVDVKSEDAARWMAKDHPTAYRFSSRPNDYFIPAIVANQAQPERAIMLVIESPWARELPSR